MKKTIGLLLLLFVAFNSSAQVKRISAKQSKDSTQKKKDIGDKLSKKEALKELNMTDDQKSKVKELMKANKAAKKTIEDDSSLSGEQKKEKIKQLRIAQMQKMKTVLSPEQIEKFKKLRNENKED